MTTLEESQTARAAWEKSCYYEMDFTIGDECTVFEAVQKFAAYDIGCLVTTNDKGKRNRNVGLIICAKSHGYGYSRNTMKLN